MQDRKELIKAIVDAIGPLIDAKNEILKTILMAEIKSVRVEIKTSEERVKKELRAEIKASEERVKKELRAEMKASEKRLTRHIDSKITEHEE